MNKRYRLRRRILVWISLPILLAGILSLCIGFFTAWHEIEEVYDAQLVHSAKVLLQITQKDLVADTPIALGEENAALSHHYERKLGFRIWKSDKLIAESNNNSDSLAQVEAPPGFSDQHADRYQWRFFVFINPDQNIRIETFERYDVRYELIYQLLSALIIPLLITSPMIFAAVWFGVRRALKPVVSISADVDRRNSDDLSAITPQELPQEIAPLVLALNRLFGRISDSFHREREFTDHAAHELRTPLAAMKTQTQVLLRKSRNFPEFAEGLENLEGSIDRATHMVGQLLALARIQNETFPKASLNLSSCIKEVVEAIRNDAQKKNIALSVSLDLTVVVSAHEDTVSILVRNLLDNAIKYTPAGGAVRIGLAKDGVLEISDTGPGLSDADKTRVFERFVRVDKTGQSGSGLGLSIARWIAQAHGWDIQLLDNAPNGLVVRISTRN